MLRFALRFDYELNIIYSCCWALCCYWWSMILASFFCNMFLFFLPCEYGSHGTLSLLALVIARSNQRWSMWPVIRDTRNSKMDLDQACNGGLSIWRMFVGATLIYLLYFSLMTWVSFTFLLPNFCAWFQWLLFSLCMHVSSDYISYMLYVSACDFQKLFWKQLV